ncbi:MAG: molybdopterin-dependent oxidoreductase [Saprospiraceae bacterium]|nr:molybdopterin-dependent oxidoreductase [Saprospiraceae bacterium]MCF8252908.1 molybdopterin-dependent oxidoreductase [Saprospiraceae bacterium]MCF8314455.1 molybdopterin-dependent oxidoreductase [Saprospiraceae bacterium]MCF8443335.1 molybdopterin-dependent oxidoreductase [Saprospiraceae bacterium]
MTLIKKTTLDRRTFLRNSILAGGGLVIGVNWLTGCKNVSGDAALTMPKEWFDINAYLKIGDNGVVTIFTPNPEFGQNVMTSMPMIVAEELDVDWKNVLVEMAPHDPVSFPPAAFGQFTGGSRGIMSKWEPLRNAGAAARHMLKEAAAQAWQVPAAEITTEAGVLFHKNSGKKAGYGEMAAAAANIPMPEKPALKEIKDFKLISHSQKNVKGKEIVTGKTMFGVDYKVDGMLIAMVEHPPAFGMKLKSVDGSAAKAMPGIKDVFTIKTYNDGYEKAMFDTNAFPELVAIVGNSTWEVMQAKKALKIEWEPIAAYSETVAGFGGKQTVTVPAGLENSTDHAAKMEALAAKPGKIVRRNGDPEAAFKKAAKVIERSYSCPHLAHNCMEPINFFADVKGDKVKVAGPLQAPGIIEPTLAARMGIPVENIEIEMTRMGGGFGRRAYSHYMVEAALISQKMNAPVKLMYTREDDMTNGVYRPAYHATYRAALDENNNLLAFHVKAGGIPESPLHADRFPAGAIDNYLAEDWKIDSNITIGAFRAPRSNFIAGAEQSFLDELAETMGKDPIEFRLELLNRAKTNPVGERNDYDAARYAGVLELVRDKSGWANPPAGVSRGVAAYFCHASYAAHVLDLTIENGKPVVQKVTSAIDCGIVVNPDAAANMTEGAVTDGIGNALYGEMPFKAGAAEKANFDKYRMIRMSEAPKAIDVHFVQNEIAPTGMGEPPFPPIFGALANALYKATGKRVYRQPFLGEQAVMG